MVLPMLEFFCLVGDDFSLEYFILYSVAGKMHCIEEVNM